jgi:hypothetical protein
MEGPVDQQNKKGFNTVDTVELPLLLSSRLVLSLSGTNLNTSFDWPVTLTWSLGLFYTHRRY